MATGSYDANGIWQYGEDDNIALFSDLLNLATESTSDAFTDDRARLATLEAGSLAGLIPLSAGTVTGVTGTVSVNSLGTVTFTGCTKVILQNVFSAAYKNYRMVIHARHSSTQDNLYARLVNSSGTEAATNYFDNGHLAYASTLTNSNTYNTTTTQLGIISPEIGLVVSDIINPFGAYGTGFATMGGGYVYGKSIIGAHSINQSNTGIALIPSTGNITGTVTVYGYNG